MSHIPRLKGATDQVGELQLLVAFNSGYSVAEPMDFVLELVSQDQAEKNGGARVANTAATKPVERRDGSASPHRPRKDQATAAKLKTKPKTARQKARQSAAVH